MSSVNNQKSCARCSTLFSKRPRDSAKQWEGREYCSPLCSNMDKKITPLHIRFWEGVAKAEGNKCWEWMGSKDINGYGKLSIGGRDANFDIRAHRLSYEMRFGPIKPQNLICHTCDNPSCVNPNHLFEGTQVDNMRDMSRKGRINPKSLLNLQPGQKGFHGAGAKNNKELL